MEITILVLGTLIGFAMVVFLVANLRRMTVFEYERGLLYHNGKFERVVAPGQHWYLHFNRVIYKLDVRPRSVTVPGQEVLTSDNVSIRISLAVNYQIEDVARALHTTNNFQESLYLMLQVQLRDLIGATAIDELLAKRKELADRLLHDCQDQARAIGIALVSLGIKDIMFPGELKNIFAQIVNARNEGLAALERARGESAALRNLANAARLLENNPALLQLRLLQSLNTGSGNTIVLKLPESDALEDLPPRKNQDGETGRAKTE